MKFGFRIPSLTKKIAANTSIKQIIRHNRSYGIHIWLKKLKWHDQFSFNWF
jgi:hypothetical protein